MIEQNFIKMIEESINKHWNLPALSDYKNQPIKYSQVAKNIIDFHNLFKKLKIEKGDKISIIGKNSKNWAITYLSVITYGAVIVPLLQDFTTSDIHHIINHSDSKLLFCDSNIGENLDENAMTNIEAIISLDNFNLLYSKKKKISLTNDELDFSENKVTFPHISNKEIATIIYTSGTTGFSKGVVLSFNSLAANLDFAKRNMPLKAGETIVSFLPVAHAFGCTFEFLFPFSSGCHITFLGKIPSPKIILKAFKEIRPRLILSVPLVIEKIYKKQIKPTLEKMKPLLKIPLINRLIYKKINKKLTEAFGGNFREIIIGGAPLNKDVELFLKKINFKYTVGYGMTECGPLISYCNWKTFKMASVGKIVDTLQIKIDSNDSFNEPGEILVRGENVMNGYYKLEDVTKKTIDEEGWLHTGDMGVIDQEGFIFIKGRTKSMILGPSGQNIYPEEIEAKLNNMELISESIIVERNGRLVALIYPDMNEVDSKNIQSSELESILQKNKNLLNKELPKYMRISSIEIHYREFEKTPKKSIKRYLYK